MGTTKKRGRAIFALPPLPLSLMMIYNTRKKTCSVYAEQFVWRYPEFFIQERDAVVSRLFTP